MLQTFSKGFTRQQVVELCDGNEQAVDIWTHFCRELEWMKCNGEPYVFDVTAEGRAALEKYGKGLTSVQNKGK